MSARRVDLVIVGGGPAGLSTALHLHAAAPALAARTVVLEQHRYPREKICAGAIGARGVRALAAIGVELDVPGVRFDAILLRLADREVWVREPALGVVVRRVEFDHALARAATARGLEVRDGCPVTGLAVTADGVRVATASGDEYLARAVVGADGVAGIVRRAAGFPRGKLRAQVVELDTEAVPGDAPRDAIVFDLAARDLAGYAWDFPTIVAGRPLVCRGVYVLRGDGDGDRAQPPGRTGQAGDARPRIDGYLAARGLDPTRYRHKHYAERGFEPGAPIARPRVLLVGEAAGIDIATGEGIAQAIEYGAVAGRYLAGALADDALDFASWPRAVDLAHVGWQLRIRHLCYQAFFSPGRARLERMIPHLPDLLRVGARDFAGAPQSARAVLRGAAQLLAGLAREGFSRPPAATPTPRVADAHG